MTTTTLTRSHLMGGTLLITGCCIGAGMIGLPVVSALSGFIPSSLAMLLCYLFTTASGLLLLEATLWFDQRVNLLTIAHMTLGKWAKYLTAALFLFLFYCIAIAYIDGGGTLISGLLSSLLAQPVPRLIGMIVCILFTGVIAYAGARIVDRANRLLIIGLALSYLTLIVIGMGACDAHKLLAHDWMASLGTIPILLICFGYQNLVPSVTYYLKKEVQAIRFAIIIGNFLPFIVYFFWNMTVIGLLPETFAFKQAASESDQVVELLEKTGSQVSVLGFVKAFSLFALLSSFLPNTLTFIDFLKDGLKNQRIGQSQIAIVLLVLVPPFLFSLFYPHIFLQALGLAGGFADVLLYGTLPVLIVWKGRYALGHKSSYNLMGGKPFLLLMLSLSLIFLSLRLFHC